MKAFKLYLKMFKKTSSVIVINMIIFLFIAFMFSGPAQEPTNDFNETIVSISFVNLDEGSILVDGLKDYLTKYVKYKEIDEKNIADALYFREIYMALTVPENFTDDFINGKEVSILQESIPGNVASESVNRAINKYLTLVSAYHQEVGNNVGDIISEVNKVLAIEVDAKTTIAHNNVIISAGYFYNYLSYLLFAVLISIVGYINIKIRRFEVKRRMTVSPYSQTKFNLEIVFGNLLFTLLFSALVIGMSYLMYPEGMRTINGLFFVLNAGCMAFTVLSISYFISLLVNSEQALSAIGNVVALGTSFICGAFVPQWLLSKGILKIAHLLPTYYYVYNNNQIVEMSDFSWENIQGLVLFMGIQVLFGVLFIALAIYANRQQLRQETN